MSDSFVLNVSVLIQHKNTFLCMKRSIHEVVLPLYWGIPGGKVERADISLEAAARRECLEEVGVVIESPLQMISNNIVAKNNTHMLYVVFATRVTELPICNSGPEVEEISWKTYQEIAALEKVTPCTADIIKQYIESNT